MISSKIFRIFVFLGFCITKSFAYTVSDVDGKTFEFSQAPKIVSLTPAVSEIVCELNMQDSLLAVSRYCVFPEFLTKKEKIGGFVDPNYEKILSLKPELIIMPKTSDANVRTRLQRLGLSVFLIHPDGIDSIEKNILLLGEIFQKQDEAKKLSAKLSEALVPQKLEYRPKALFLFGKMAAGKGSYVGELLERAGFENIAEKSNAAWPVLSREFIVINPPEVLILELKSGENKEKLANFYQNDSLWAKTPAVKNKHIYYIDSEKIIVPAPRLIETSKILKEISKNFRAYSG